ncbi:MAG: sigma-70 family RNA polymerase sigma factor [bacterium]
MSTAKEKQEHGRLFCRYRERGDIEAFERLLREFEGPLYSYLLRFLRNPTEAEDALQEVWLKAIRRAESYRERGQFSSWLYRIAHNHCLDILRRRGKLVEMEPETEQRDTSVWPDGSSELTKDPFEVLEERELLAYLDREVAKLPPALQEVFVLRTSSELSFREISEILGCPLGTVLGRMHQATIKIRTRFKATGLTPADKKRAMTSV